AAPGRQRGLGAGPPRQQGGRRHKHTGGTGAHRKGPPGACGTLRRLLPPSRAPPHPTPPTTTRPLTLRKERQGQPSTSTPLALPPRRPRGPRRTSARRRPTGTAGLKAPRSKEQRHTSARPQ
ncbi:hypothetical protein TcCL_Unassigned01761, partial [Trypanosoma cruzi]